MLIIDRTIEQKLFVLTIGLSASLLRFNSRISLEVVNEKVGEFAESAAGYPYASSMLSPSIVILAALNFSKPC